MFASSSATKTPPERQDTGDVEVRCGFCDFAADTGPGDLVSPGFLGFLEVDDGMPVRFHPRPGIHRAAPSPAIPYNVVRSVAEGLVVTCGRGHRYLMNRTQLEAVCRSGPLVLPPEPARVSLR